MSGNKLNINNPDSGKITEKLFAMTDKIRYVAVYRNGVLEATSRPNLDGASSSESDKYEEIIVNPTLLTLLRQRGEIDCGGVEYVIIRYGNFYQCIHPLPGGHISIAFQPESNYNHFLPEIQKLLKAEFY
ncbi:MAG: hypothetical protein HY276_07155 [Ignavibacteriales bacterium]|nr:hypothetical protein [Ignavibacteriales bacterium]